MMDDGEVSFAVWVVWDASMDMMTQEISNFLLIECGEKLISLQVFASYFWASGQNWTKETEYLFSSQSKFITNASLLLQW